MPQWFWDLLPIVLLLVVIAIVVSNLPKIDIGHSPQFLRRRTLNWLPVGLTYAFLYMARYNLNAAIGPVFGKTQFAEIYFWGTLAYGVSFVINGPLTDKLGGKKTILISAVGSLFSSLMMGFYISGHLQNGEVPKEARDALVPVCSALYVLNMYFQSFGAVSIVKINSSWFHLRERGTFGGIFGILISLGLYFAFDWCSFIAKKLGIEYAFYIPAGILLIFAVLDFFLVKDHPSEAGFEDFDVGDASSGDTGPRQTALAIAIKMFKNPALVTIMLIEFCSGYLRNSILQFYKPFAKEVGRTTDFVLNNWGMLNCVAGILGGIFAGVISDRIFQSRRGPVSAVLYGIMIVGGGLMFITLQTSLIGWVVIVMSLAIIGVHGMLSGTASADFGGKKNAGIAVGIIDGFVYLGVAIEALVLGAVLPKDGTPEAKDPSNWWTWPAAILPFAVIGFFLALRVWNAKAQPKSAGH